MSVEDAEKVLADLQTERARLIARGVDPLLAKLRKVHGAASRPNIALEIATATRAAARRVEAAAEMVPAS